METFMFHYVGKWAHTKKDKIESEILIHMFVDLLWDLTADGMLLAALQIYCRPLV